MKKLVIAMAIVCLAMVSQAAKFRWGAGTVMDASGSNPYTGSATLYCIINGTDVSVATAQMTDGSIASAVYDIAPEGMVVNTSYSFYYTMEDSEGNVFTSGIKSAKAQASATSPLAFSTQGTWETVPEPTSGLLLLLGVAGLALRRRRA